MTDNSDKIKIIIGSDHAGFRLKESIYDFLKSQHYVVFNYGTYSDTSSVDYPVIALEVAKRVSQGEYTYGIIVCGSGIGVAIAANKVKGIRAATCNDLYTAKMSRMHNDANIITLGARILAPELAYEIVSLWLSTSFENGRHQGRVKLIESFETSQEGVLS